MTLNKSKVNVDQNLIPNKLIYTYLYQKTLIPAVIVIISVLFLSVGVYFGINWLTEDYIEKTMELTSQDLSSNIASSEKVYSDKVAERDKLQKEYDDYYVKNPIKVSVDDSILKRLESEIKALMDELDRLENMPDTPTDEVVDVNEKYHIEDLLLYIDAIRTQNLAIVSIEDSKTAGSNQSSYLIYDQDVGKASFSLHGIATSPSELSKFMTSLNECEYIDTTKVVSIETQTVSNGPSLYVFEVIITPKVN